MSDNPLHILRTMILHGDLLPGERVTESGLAERLGLSRTPIRNVLPALAAEGFLEKHGKRGYAVKQFNTSESIEALELRAQLEAIAAKKIALKGASSELLTELNKCLALGDRIFEKRRVEHADKESYGKMNALFHSLIVNNCDSDFLKSFIERLNRVPFIAPSAVVFDEVSLDQAYEILFRAHGQHHAIVDAIREGNGERCERLFKEHGNSQRQSIFSKVSKNDSTQK